MPSSYRSLLFTIALWLVAAAGAVELYRFARWRRAETMSAEIDALVAAGDATAAIERLRRYVTVLPSDRGRLVLLARLLVDRALAGEADAAEMSFTRDTLRLALSRVPEDRDLREKLVLFLLAGGDAEGALRHLEILRVRDGAEGIDDDATRRIGILYAKAALASGKGTESYEMLRRLVDFPPGTPIPPGRREAFAMLAVMLVEGLRDPGGAEGVLERMTAAYPDDAEAWKILAAWHLDRRHAEAALDAATRAVALSPLDSGALSLEASAARACGEVDRARAIVDGPLADAPLSRTLVTTRAGLAAARGDAAGMAAILRAGIDALPEDASLLAEALVVLVDGGRLDDVRDLLPAARKELGPESVPVLYAEATLDTFARRWIPALRAWERLGDRLDADPDRSRRIAIAVAACHAALGQTDQAAAARRRAGETAPRSLAAVALEVANLEESGRGDEALTLLERSAASRETEEILTLPGIWQPLLRLRIEAQGRLPPELQDWSAVDALAAAAEADPGVPTEAKEAFRIRILEAKHEAAAAIAAAEAAFAARPDDPAAAATALAVLARSGAAEEAASRLAVLPESLRNSADVLALESTLARSPGTPGSDGLSADVERRALALKGPDGIEVRRRLALVEATAGRDAEAERMALGIVADAADDLPSWQLLLELALERSNVPLVAERAEAIVRLVGPDSAVGRMARAARIVAEIGSSRDAEAVAAGADPSADVGDALVEARGLLAAAAAEMPSSPDVERRLAELAAARGDIAGAIGHHRRAMALRESVPWSRRRLATTLVAAGRYDEAAPVIVSLATTGSSGGLVGRLQSELLAAKGRRREALELAATITPADGRDPDQLVWHAGFLARMAAPEEAEAACRRAIEAIPGRAAPRLTLLELQWRRGQKRQAAATVRSALESLDGPARDWFESRAAHIVGGEARLERRYREAAAAGDPAARRRLVGWLLAEGRTSEARDELEGLLRDTETTDEDTARWARRRLAAILGRSPARADLQEALRLLDANADADALPLPEDTALAAALLVRRTDPASWRRALSLLDRVDEERGLSIDEQVLRADVRRRLGGRQRERAREELAAIASTPDVSAAVLGMLVDMAIDDGDPRAARDWLDKLRDIAPGTPATLLLAARTARAEGDTEGAATTATSLVPTERVNASNAARMTTLAALAEEAGAPDVARAVFAAAADLSVEGTLRWARFLGRRGRTDDAITALESARGRCSPVAFLEALVAITEATDEAGLAAARPRIDGLASALRRENPGSSVVDLHLALLADVIGREDEAAAAYRSLLADADLPVIERGIATGNLASLLARPESSAESLALVEEAIAALGPLPDLLDTRALARSARGDSTAALEDIADAALQPTARRFLHMAVVQLAAGNRTEARTALSKAESLGLGAKRLSPGDVARKRMVEAALDAADAAG